MIRRTNVRCPSILLSAQGGETGAVRTAKSEMSGMRRVPHPSSARALPGFSGALTATILRGFGPQHAPQGLPDGAGASPVLARHLRRLQRIRQPDAYKRASGLGLSTGQFVTGLGILAQQNEAPWLNELLPRVHELWMIEGQGKAGRHRRKAVLDCIAKLLKDYRGLARDDDELSTNPEREILQHLVVAIVLQQQSVADRPLVEGTAGSASNVVLSLHSGSTEQPTLNALTLQRHRRIHVPEEAQGPTYSPFTLADELRIRGAVGERVSRPESGRASPTICLVFGVLAAGINDVSRALASQTRLAKAGPDATDAVIAIKALRPLRELRASLRAMRSFPGRLIHIEMPPAGEDLLLHEEILECIYAARLGSQLSGPCVLLTFGPSAAWQWVASGMTSLEASMSIVRLGPWTAGAVAKALEDLSFRASAQRIDTLVQRMGGWQRQVQAFMHLARGGPAGANLDKVLEGASQREGREDAAAALKGLGEFGLFDIPHAYEVFKNAVEIGIHGGFNRNGLRSAATRNPATAQVCIEHLIEAGLRLSLLRSAADQPDVLHIDPTIVSLIQRFEATA